MIIDETPIDNMYLIYPKDGPKFPDAVTILYDGHEKLLIDVGIEFNRLEEALKRFNLNIGDLDYIVLTHLHPDHCKSVWRFKELNEDIVIFLNELEAKYSYSWESFFKFYGFNDKSDIIDEWLEVVGNPLDFKPFRVDEVYKFDDEMEFRDIKLQFFHTPGHTIGHTAIMVEDLLITGDIDLTNFPWYGHPSSNLDDFIESVKRLMEINARYLVSMHRGLITQNIKEEFENYLRIIYERDKRVYSTLKEGGNLNFKLGERGIIYPKISSKIIKFFEENMVEKHVKRLSKNLSI